MGTSFNTIQFHAERCDGCGDCMLACAREKSGTDNLAHSRIRVLPGTASVLTSGPAPALAETISYELALCRQCGDPKCVSECPVGRIAEEPGQRRYRLGRRQMR